MEEMDIRNLLIKADKSLNKGNIEQQDIALAVRRKLYRGRMMRITSSMLMLFLTASSLGLWQYIAVRQQMLEGRDKIALLEGRLGKLETKTESKLERIDKTLNRLSRLNNYFQTKTQVANMEDPIEQVRREFDKTGSIIVSSGDRLYRDYNLKSQAIDEYKRVIRLMPESKWAEVARQRINDIRLIKAGKRGAI
jgi:hypothetical protein